MNKPIKLNQLHIKSFIIPADKIYGGNPVRCPKHTFNFCINEELTKTGCMETALPTGQAPPDACN